MNLRTLRLVRRPVPEVLREAEDTAQPLNSPGDILIKNVRQHGVSRHGAISDRAARQLYTPAGDPVPDYRQLGFRVPCIVASRWSPKGVVHDGPYEHTSVLKMIEWRWGLAPLTQRDANARNLAEVLDFTSTRTDSPDVPVLASFASVACGPTSTAKRPPDPVSTPPPASSTSGSDAAATSGGRLARTGGTEPLLAIGAAAITGGMALRAAHRRALRSDAELEPTES